jgi:hypothetical protein
MPATSSSSPPFTTIVELPAHKAISSTMGPRSSKQIQKEIAVESEAETYDMSSVYDVHNDFASIFADARAVAARGIGGLIVGTLFAARVKFSKGKAAFPIPQLAYSREHAQEVARYAMPFGARVGVLVAGVYGIDAALMHARGRRDPWNGMFAGVASGIVLGARVAPVYVSYFAVLGAVGGASVSKAVLLAEEQATRTRQRAVSENAADVAAAVAAGDDAARCAAQERLDELRASKWYRRDVDERGCYI